jgi:hypothetical protein
MNPFREALEILDGGRKWTKGAYHSYDYDNYDYDNDRPVDRYCLMGAIGSTNGTKFDHAHQQAWYDDAEYMLCDVIREQFPERIYDAVEQFNDHESTTWSEVERVLEKAAVTFDEKL